MSETIEDYNKMPPVEKFITDKITVDFGSYAGTKRLEFSDLITLRSLIDHQLMDLKPFCENCGTYHHSGENTLCDK